jgi:uncharacterized protein (DUF2237 family)
LKVQAAKTDPTKFQTKDGWDSARMVICASMNAARRGAKVQKSTGNDLQTARRIKRERSYG